MFYQALFTIELTPYRYVQSIEILVWSKVKFKLALQVALITFFC